MSGDWRARVDSQLAEEERQRREDARRESERQAQEKSAKLRQEQEQREAQARSRLKAHQDRFRCNFQGCQNTSPEYGSSWYPGTGGMDGTEGGWATDENVPTYVSQCQRCQRWRCPEHIHHGICQACAEGGLTEVPAPLTLDLESGKTLIRALAKAVTSVFKG